MIKTYFPTSAFFFISKFFYQYKNCMTLRRTVVHQLISVLKPGLVIADKLQTATDYMSHKTIINIFIKMDLTFTDLGHDVGCLHSQIEIIIWILLVKVVVDIRLVRDPPEPGVGLRRADFLQKNWLFSICYRQAILYTIIIYNQCCYCWLKLKIYINLNSTKLL